MSTSLRVLAAAGLSAALLLTACGSGGSGGSGSSAPAASSATKAASQVEGLPADQVLAKAQAALASAKTVHLVLKAGDSNGTSSFDLRMAQGPNASGTLSLSGQEVKLVRIAGDAWVTGSPQFISGLTKGSAPAGKWVKVPVSTPGFSSLLDIADLTKLSQLLKPKGAVSIGTPKVVDGKQTVALVDAGSKGSTLYVSAEGTPYPLLIEPKDTKAGESATFTEYDAPVTFTPPPAGDVVEATNP